MEAPSPSVRNHSIAGIFLSMRDAFFRSLTHQEQAQKKMLPIRKHPNFVLLADVDYFCGYELEGQQTIRY
ncbi:hypothetical protein SAMN04487936_102332 [Halobacillus dabanensis]|uniref:Uncharacterized protein n=1 Tax=Halobacillus dabanensis TaxID=240302 RepID=A0A1I3RRB2_HALDA|nr:hypothetical protein SAMN04487936_102332 [Halobacillus dabanensis]